MKKIFCVGSLSVALTAGMSATANAALVNNSVLNFETGGGLVYSGISFVTRGSYFGIDTDGSGRVSSRERTAISQNEGVIIGQEQLLPPSVPSPDGQVSVIDVWSQSNHTVEGTHWTSSPANILTDDGEGNVTIDLSGLTLNAGGQNIFLEGSGVAQIICAIDCSDGDSYTLDYSANIAFGDISGFGGLGYVLHLEGTISAVPVPATAWLFGSGLLGLAGIARRRRAV